MNNRELFRALHELYVVYSNPNTRDPESLAVIVQSGRKIDGVSRHVTLDFRATAGVYWDAFCEIYTPIRPLTNAQIAFAGRTLPKFWKMVNIKRNEYELVAMRYTTRRATDS
jgi:hypothetical protein